MRGVIAIVFAVLLVGCGGSGFEGVLAWQDPPQVGSHAVSGKVENSTSHSVNLNTKAMRLLDDHGRKVSGKFEVGSGVLPKHASTTLRATWKSGQPVLIDYGAGTLALPSK